MRHIVLEESKDLNRLLGQFGITEFVYTVHFCGEQSVGGASRKKSSRYSYDNTLPNQALKMHFVSSGNDDFVNLMGTFIHTGAHLFKDFASEALDKFYFPNSSLKTVRHKNIRSKFHALNINSAVYHQVRGTRHGYIGAFILYSNFDGKTLCNKLMPHQDKLKAILSKYHEILYGASPIKLNPWRNLNIISPTCCSILQRLAQGDTTAAIAEGLYLSRRGVDYHLENAKGLLNASNRSNLIAKAVAYGIIDSSDL